MKFGKLVIRNIASIEDATIDFCGDALGKAALFLICGETGAGKSTILDSICLALYNRTPRMEAASGRGKYNIGTDQETTITDARQLLRRATGEGGVVFEFTGTDGLHYTARWSVQRARRKPNGRLQDIKRELYCRETHETEDKSKAIDEAVRQHAVGLSFAQFCRTVMLAQGQFGLFLTGSESEKAEVLEKLTDTAVYSAIGQRISQLTSDSKNKIELAQAEMQGITLLSDEQRRQIEAEMAQRQAEHQQTDRQCAATEETLRWIDDREKRLSERQEAQDRLAQAQRQVDCRQNHDNILLVNQWDATEQQRAAVRQLSKARTEVERLAGQQVAMTEQYEALLDAVAWVQELQTNRQRELQSVTESLGDMQPMSHVWENSRSIIARLQTAENIKTAMTGNERVINERSAELPEQTQTLSEAKQTAGEAHKAVDESAERIEFEQKTLSDLHPDEVESTLKLLNAKKLQLQQAEAQMRLLGDREQDLSKVRRQIEQLGKAQEQNQREIAEQQQLLGSKRDEATRACSAYDKAHRSLEDWADNARKSLKIGDICPVCGEQVRKILDDEHFKSIAEPFEQDMLRAREQLQACEVALMTMQNERKRLADEISEIETEQTELQKALTDQENATRQTLNRCDYQAEIANAGEWIATQKKLIDIKLAENEQKQVKISQQRDCIDRLQKAHKSLLKAQSFADYELKKAEDTLTDTRTKLDQAAVRLDEQQKQLQLAIQQVDTWWKGEQWQEQWTGREQAFVDRLTEQAESFTRLKERKNELESQFSQAEAMLHRLRDNQPEAIKRLTISAERNPSANDDIEQDWQEFCNKLTEWVAMMTAAQQNLEQHAAVIDHFMLEQTDIDRARIDELARLPETTVRELRQEIEKTKAELELANGLAQEADKRLEQHMNERPDSMSEQPDKAALKIKFEQLADRRRSLNEQVGALRQQLDSDTEAQRHIGHVKNRIDTLRQEHDNWEVLNRHLSNDRFRRVAQTFILGDLLHKSNYFMRRFNDRYTLTCQHDSLNILLEDALTGQVSSVNTLSGGEGFMAALALALALAQMNSGRVDVDTIFIDEGFGSLSPNYLERVMDTLRQLRQDGGRRVGIISHVEALKETVATAIQVRRTQGGTLSRVEITSE